MCVAIDLWGFQSFSSCFGVTVVEEKASGSPLNLARAPPPGEIAT